MMEICMIALTNRIKDHWSKYAWLLLQKLTIDGNMHGCFYKKWPLMERCMVALQNRRNIDGMMYGCFTKQKDYWWKDAWLFYKTEGLLIERCKVDGKMYGCFTCRQN